ncbi:MAG: iron ABC transporter permease [Deltaproteobacteria bacterium]|jgi:iron complex transport system permease protein|nr:iron ABC transporter permease [Deltaproteobacteria bacterium]
MNATTVEQPLRRLSPVLLGLVLGAALILAAVISLSSGHMPFTAGEIAEILVSWLTGAETEISENRLMVLREVRLPRLTAALVSGAALGLSGAVYQGLLLNPLADPYTLGVSSGAAFGASVVIILSILAPGIPFLGAPAVQAAGAFIASALTLALVIALASDADKRLSPTSLILAGVILSAILSAGISFIKYLAGEQVSSIIFWLLGSFQAQTWPDAALVTTFFLPAFAISILSATDLNIMTLGFKSAETLGVDTRRVRLKLLAAASLAASASVAVAGIIGFVGLIVPHLVRLLTGPDHRSLLPLSTLGGALLLLSADTVVRAFLPGEIPVGVLTALLAGPAFLVIFRKKMKDLIHG